MPSDQLIDDTFILNIQIDEEFGGFVHALLAEGEVVFHSSPLIAMTFHNQFIVLIFQIHRGTRFEDRLCLRFKIVFVVIKMK